MCMHTLSNTRKSTQQEIKVLRVTKSAEKCKQSIDELLLDQDVCQSHYTDSQSPGEDRYRCGLSGGDEINFALHI